MNKEMPTATENIRLNLDVVTSEQLQKYMQFVHETNRFPQYDVAEHAVSLLSFALEEHETFQAWLSAGNRVRSISQTRVASPLEVSEPH